MSTTYTDDYSKLTFVENSSPDLSAVNMNHMETGIKTLYGRVATMSSEMSDIDEALADAEDDISALQTSTASLGTRMTTAEGDIDSVEADVAEAQTDISALETSVGSLGTRMTTAEGDIDSLESGLATAEGNIETLQTSMATAEGDIDTLETSMTEAQTDITALETSTTSLGERLGTAEESITAHGTRLNGVDEDIEGLTDDMTEAQSDISLAQTELVRLDMEKAQKPIADSTSAPFTTRTISAKSGGVARISKIYGNSVLTKNLFAPTRTSYSGNGLTITNNGDGTYKITGTATEVTNINFGYIDLKDGVEYKLIGFGGTGVRDVFTLYLYDGATYPNDIGNGAVFTAVGNTTQGIKLRVDEGRSVDMVCKPMITTDTSLTYADFTPYFSGIRSFLPSGIKVTGKNLADLSDGNLTADHCTYSRIPNGLRAVATSAMYPMVTVSLPEWLAGYHVVFSANKLAVSGNASPDVNGRCVVNGVVTYLNSNTDIPLGAKNIVMRLIVKSASDAEVGATVDFTNIQLEISNLATAYEPYHESILLLPITEVADGMFADGMKSAGSVRDELTRDKAVKRIGVVDLGTLDWTLSASNPNCFYVRVNDSVQYPFIPSASAREIGMLCSKYQYAGYRRSAPYYGEDGELTVYMNSMNRELYIHDSNYSDATAFKASLSGVYLFYELATPQSVSLATQLLLTYEAEVNGTETLIVPIGVESSPMVADTDYLASEADVNNSFSLVRGFFSEYDGTSVTAGKLRTHEGKLYQNTSGTTVSGTWNASYWTERSLDYFLDLLISHIN